MKPTSKEERTAWRLEMDSRRDRIRVTNNVDERLKPRPEIGREWATPLTRVERVAALMADTLDEILHERNALVYLPDSLMDKARIAVKAYEEVK